MAIDPPQPIMPSPDGWRQPTFLPPNIPRRLHAPWTLLAAGLLTSVVIAIAGWLLVSIAWNACESDLGLSTSFTLWGLLGVMVGGACLAYLIGCIAIQPGSVLARYAVGTLVVIATVLAIVTANVPRSDPAAYQSIDALDHPECRPNGVPPWWPAWLPS